MKCNTCNITIEHYERIGTLSPSQCPSCKAHDRVRKTARPWRTTKVYRAALDVIGNEDRVVDFGSGPYMNCRNSIVKQGAYYIPYDKPYGINIDLPTEMPGKADVVLASNVVNTVVYSTTPLPDLLTMLIQMHDLLKPEGHLVINAPQGSSPHPKWLTPKRLRCMLEHMFINVQQEGEVLTCWQKV